MPNEPYTPTIKEISLDYSSVETLNLSASAGGGNLETIFNSRTDQFFHVHPFGVSEVHEYLNPNPPGIIYLLPQYREEGNLYIGLNDMVPGQNIHFLFQVSEGSADPDFEPQKVNWFYLSENHWVKFNNADIISDSTKGLLTSGIISFALPKAATDNNTLLPAGQHWIRASVNENTVAIPDVIEIMAQAAPAAFIDNQNDPEHLREALPAGTIKKLKEADSAVDKIKQPFSSFGGKVKEESEDYYTRVSERLRHKDRAITIWDYEHLVLEKFPKVYKVKCLNHTLFTGTLTDYSEMAPGHVSLIVVSNLRNKNAVNPLKPKTSLITLTEIHDFLQKRKSHCPALHVKNPLFEEIKVDFNVKFFNDVDKGFFETKLIGEIQQFLSPWAFSGQADIVFGGRIHKSMIINFVEERPYVDFVTCFKMYHIVPTDPSNDPTKDLDEAIATTAASVLVSSESHLIYVLETEDCECEDNEILPTATLLSEDDCPCE